MGEPRVWKPTLHMCERARKHVLWGVLEACSVGCVGSMFCGVCWKHVLWGVLMVLPLEVQYSEASVIRYLYSPNFSLI